MITRAISISALVVLVFAVGCIGYLFRVNATQGEIIRAQTQSLAAANARLNNLAEDAQSDEIIDKLPDLSVVPNAAWMCETSDCGSAD